MARRPRPDLADICTHVVNRFVRRKKLFYSAADYLAFETILRQALDLFPVRLLAYCIMPNHWHFVVQPHSSAELAAFTKWLSQTHASRWHVAHGTVGTGGLYQGRYKVFPVESDEHLHIVCRYTERNALRAGLVPRAEDWRWGSLWHRCKGDPSGFLSPWPTPPRSDWVEWVNAPRSDAELEALRRCVARGAPFGSPSWTQSKLQTLSLESTVASLGRRRLSKLSD